MTALREQILAEMIPVEKTDISRGINQGLLTALRIVDAHDCAESIKAALSALQAQGMKKGGDVPYGYRRVEEGSQILTEDEGEQEVIAIARRLRAAGTKLQDIADYLRAEGKRPRPSRRPGTNKRYHPKHFHPKQISRMIEPSTAELARVGTTLPVSPARRP